MCSSLSAPHAIRLVGSGAQCLLSILTIINRCFDDGKRSLPPEKQRTVFVFRDVFRYIDTVRSNRVNKVSPAVSLCGYATINHELLDIPGGMVGVADTEYVG